MSKQLKLFKNTKIILHVLITATKKKIYVHILTQMGKNLE